MTTQLWPDLTELDMRSTLETLHLWTQIPGKIKIATQPWLNESWHVPLYMSAAGFTTGQMPYGAFAFDLEIDLIKSVLRLRTSDGGEDSFGLHPSSVAEFYQCTLQMLTKHGIDVELWPHPCELEGATSFVADTAQRTFHLATARTYWRALLQVQRVFQRFRSRFVGKSSPVHFFWGSFDLAVTRFSGRPAPLVEQGGPGMPLAVAQDAYAAEQAGFGFWPGGTRGVDGPAFYIEAWPAPRDFADARVRPCDSKFVEALGEWVLDYEVVRASADPDEVLLGFLESGYEAIADAGGWDRTNLERDEGPIGHPPPARASRAPGARTQA